MISQLYQSRPSATRDFEFKGVHFGWKAIEDMYRRELARIKANTIVRVPGLKESYIVRDSWTRLNVKPAKIMQVRIRIYMYYNNHTSPTIFQQEHVIAELKEYATATPPPSDAKEVLCVVDFLEACNKMFERGLLGHVRIPTYPNQILTNMKEGYSFFTRWLDSLLQNGTLHVQM